MFAYQWLVFLYCPKVTFTSLGVQSTFWFGEDTEHSEKHGLKLEIDLEQKDYPKNNSNWK